MLCDLWQKTVIDHGPEWAVIDLAAGVRFTFAELDRVAHARPVRPVFFSAGHSIDFILEVIQAWKSGAVFCPLEKGQLPPDLRDFPSGCVHLKTTSGSTGASRAIAFTGEQLAADVRQIVSTMGLRSDWPNVAAISLAHSYGFSNLILPLLLHGIPLVLVPAPLPELMRRACGMFPEVTVPAVPAMWRAWHEAGAIPANIRLAISAGAPLPLTLEEEVFQQRGLKLHNFYGSSECGGIAYDRSDAPRSDPALAGRAMEGVRLRCNSENLLEVTSPATGLTYWPEPDESLGKGVFVTSDFVDIVDGKVFLRGRATDQINVAGRKVFPETIERVLNRHPGVRQCLVFGLASGEPRADLIVACVEGEAGQRELQQFLLEQLPAWQLPREWWFVELPPNSRGKLSRAEWRKRFLERGGKSATGD